jgi:hypothetical protein
VCVQHNYGKEWRKRGVFGSESVSRLISLMLVNAVGPRMFHAAVLNVSECLENSLVDRLSMIHCRDLKRLSLVQD